MHNGQSTRAVTTQCHKRTRTDVNFTQEHSIGELKATSHQGGAPHVALSIASHLFVTLWPPLRAISRSNEGGAIECAVSVLMGRAA